VNVSLDCWELLKIRGKPLGDSLDVADGTKLGEDARYRSRAHTGGGRLAAAGGRKLGAAVGPEARSARVLLRDHRRLQVGARLC
jgi:hypothetical protein